MLFKSYARYVLSTVCGHETVCSIVDASISITLSYTASSSGFISLNLSPLPREIKYSLVFSSGMNKPH